MTKMRAICDTWNMIDRYDIQNWKQDGCIVYIPDSEYERLLNSVVNKRYIMNLKRS